jgi:hypothetical protein
MKINLKRIFSLVIVSILMMITFVGLNVSAVDDDRDGLDDQWEADNGYDNTTKDKVVV